MLDLSLQYIAQSFFKRQRFYGKMNPKSNIYRHMFKCEKKYLALEKNVRNANVKSILEKKTNR